MSTFVYPINLMAALCCLVMLSITPAKAQISASASLGTGYLSGNTQYQIGGHVITADDEFDIHFPLSELKFPLDAFMVQGQFNVQFADRWRMMANLATNITDDTGKLEDSDWGVTSADPTTLDIFSESDAKMDALLFDGKIDFMIYQAYLGAPSADEKIKSGMLFSYFVGLGYKYQKFNFDVSNVDQWYPSDPTAPHDLVSGLVLTYEAEYRIPYVELSMEMNVAERFLLELGLAYAPFVDFQDEDNHILRDKVSTADHDWNGDAEFVRLKGHYNFNQYFYIEADVQAMRIQSKGQQNQYFGGDLTFIIDQEIKSEQYSAYLSLGSSF
jgi:outer membrane protease